MILKKDPELKQATCIDDLLDIKIKWYEYPGIWWHRLLLKFWYPTLCYFKNCWRFRKILSQYESFDFSYDLDLLLKVYELKEKEWELYAVNFVEGAEKDLLKIREIKEQIQKVIEMSCALNSDYIKEYQKLFQLLKQSYKFWW
jgi:hypothetical protein